MGRAKNRLVFHTAYDEYTSSGVVGEGATSVVHKVVDSDGEPWALKCLRATQANSTRTKRFLNELHFCSRSTHKNVVRVQDEGFITQDGKKCPFYVMPLFVSTLRKEISKGIAP